MPQLSTSACLSIARIACLVELLEDVAEAQDHHLVADDQHAPVAIMEVDGVEHRPQPQDHVGPALAAGRPVIEFAEPLAVRGFLREFVADAGRRQPVEDAELALAQPLVDDGPRRAAGSAPCSQMIAAVCLART